MVVRGTANKDRQRRDLVLTMTVQGSMWVTGKVSIHQGCRRTGIGAVHGLGPRP